MNMWMDFSWQDFRNKYELAEGVLREYISSADIIPGDSFLNLFICYPRTLPCFIKGDFPLVLQIGEVSRTKRTKKYESSYFLTPEQCGNQRICECPMGVPLHDGIDINPPTLDTLKRCSGYIAEALHKKDLPSELAQHTLIKRLSSGFS